MSLLRPIRPPATYLPGPVFPGPYRAAKGLTPDRASVGDLQGIQSVTASRIAIRLPALAALQFAIVSPAGTQTNGMIGAR